MPKMPWRGRRAWALAWLAASAVAPTGAAQEGAHAPGVDGSTVVDSESREVIPLDPAFEVPVGARPVVRTGSLRASSAAVTSATMSATGAGKESVDVGEYGLGDDDELDDDARAILPNGTSMLAAKARRLIAKLVFCTCKSGGAVICKRMMFSLLQCNPSCPALCHGSGLAFDQCAGVRQVGWLQRMHTKYTDCKNSPLR